MKRGERLLPQLDAAKLDELVCCDVERGVERRPTIRRLAAVIRARQIDVVVCTNTYSMLYGYLARRLIAHDEPKLATVLSPRCCELTKRRRRCCYLQRLFKRSDLLLYVRENQRGYWRDRGLRAAADECGLQRY